jgi:hypothetical protein
MVQAFTRALSLLPGWARLAVVGVALFFLYRFIETAGWYLFLAAALGWAALLLAVSRETGHLARLTSIGPVGRALDWLTSGASAPAPGSGTAPLSRGATAGGKAAPDDRRQRLAATVTAAQLRRVLDEGLLGQKELTAEVAREVEIFVNKRSPAKPLSIAVAGPSGSGRTTFAEALAAATAFEGKTALLRINCANDAEADFSKVAGALKDAMLPVLLLDNFDRIGNQRHAGAFVAALTRILDDGVIDGKPVLRHAIIVLTVLVDSAIPAEAWRRIAQTPGEASLIMRDALGASGKLPDDILTRVDVVNLIKPLDHLGQAAVVWKVFCQMAASEHGIVILQDRIGEADGLTDFLVGALATWQRAGDSGVREAARYVGRMASDALVEASRAGHRTVRAYWDRRAKRLCLNPVASPASATP